MKIRVKKWLGNIILLLCSLSLVLGLAELAMRLVWKEDTHSLYHILPGGMHMMPNTDAVYSSSEFEFKVVSNRFGHRDRQWTDSVMKDSSNIVFIGDSFVFGYGVNDADSVPTALEREIEAHGSKAEVFNLGLGGGLPEYRILTGEAIEKFQARTILIGLFLGNDFTEIPVYTHAEGAASSATTRFQAPTLDDSALYRFAKGRFSGSPLLTGLVFKVGKKLNRDLYPTNTGYIFLKDWTAKQQALFDSFLSQSLGIAAVSQENGRQAVFVIFPNKIQVENAADLTSSVYDAGAPNRRILDYCTQHHLSCLDLLPVLREAYEQDHRPLFFPVDRHMNAEGNKIAAKSIREYLWDKQEFPKH